MDVRTKMMCNIKTVSSILQGVCYEPKDKCMSYYWSSIGPER